MRPRKIWLILGIATLAAVLILATSRPSDEFTFLRKFDHTEKMQVSPLGIGWERSFTFKDPPPGLYTALGLPSKKAWHSFPPDKSRSFRVANRPAYFNYHSSQLIIWAEPEPSWLSRQWMALSAKLSR